jgi:lipopolysaccharide export system permease protein
MGAVRVIRKPPPEPILRKASPQSQGEICRTESWRRSRYTAGAFRGSMLWRSGHHHGRGVTACERLGVRSVTSTMRVITRAILKEMVTVASITLLGLVVLVLLQQAVRLADLITEQGVSLLTIAPILALALPALLVTIFPVCALMAPAIIYSRLATDSELLALRATGYSFYQLLTPVLGLGIFMGVVTAILVLEVIPHANFLARQQIFEAVSTSLQLRIHERVFQSPIPGLVIYVEHIDEKSGLLEGVLIADNRSPETTTIFASEAEIIPDFAGMRVVVRMRNGSLLRRPGEQGLQQAAFERYSFVIEVGNPWDSAELSRKRIREMTLGEIGAQVQVLKANGGNYLRAMVEWHKRVALPASCLVLGFVGAPVGGLNRRTGRLGGFAISAGSLLLYYILVTAGSSLAETGSISPTLGVWGPNALAVAIAAYLGGKVNGQRPFARTKRFGAAVNRPLL